ncbi:hypothetical protein [Paenibacillus hexagrammi]|uniref:Uncharacterized protein n=1 Tax=Paenibacillus hexagrammi TaxID=2908839 RepID=A0ABY3SUE8_9BACL|nr:hypothetical protein [Paenibacillus sp. YPD9-1]UJF36567.1 hypothetical protein L0M14_30735 [Paenibacillus sp. YPD9-1]
MFMVREQVPMVTGTSDFWAALAKKLSRNDHVSTEEFAALYYATVLVYNAYLRKEPSVLIVTLDDAKRIEELEERYQAPTYADMIQTLYITWSMEKPNGREFCEGSLRFSDAEYAERRQLVEREIAEMKTVAERYVANLDKLQVQTVTRKRP